MSQRCQTAHGWSDDIVCYGFVEGGTVEQLDVGSECVFWKPLTKKLYNMFTQGKV